MFYVSLSPVKEIENKFIFVIYPQQYIYSNNVNVTEQIPETNYLNQIYWG